MNTNEYTTTPVMSIEDISISYGDDKYAVKNVSAKIEEHSITAIMGPSGCGKTTLLRADDVPKTSGQIADDVVRNLIEERVVSFVVSEEVVK